MRLRRIDSREARRRIGLEQITRPKGPTNSRLRGAQRINAWSDCIAADAVYADHPRPAKRPQLVNIDALINTFADALANCRARRMAIISLSGISGKNAHRLPKERFFRSMAIHRRRAVSLSSGEESTTNRQTVIVGAISHRKETPVSSTDNGQLLRQLIEKAGITQIDALIRFNEGQALTLSLGQWKAYLAKSDSARRSPCPPGVLNRAKELFSIND